MSTGTTGGDGQRTGAEGAAEDETQQLLERLRSAPAAEILAELFGTLLSTAQVKLGRRDARLFIDLCSQALEYAGPHLPADLRTEVGRALGQLRLAQVNAENETSRDGEPEPNDLSRIPTPPPTGGHRNATDAGSEAAPPTSKLWVPGR